MWLYVDKTWYMKPNRWVRVGVGLFVLRVSSVNITQRRIELANSMVLHYVAMWIWKKKGDQSNDIKNPLFTRSDVWRYTKLIMAFLAFWSERFFVWSTPWITMLFITTKPNSSRSSQAADVLENTWLLHIKDERPYGTRTSLFRSVQIRYSTSNSSCSLHLIHSKLILEDFSNSHLWSQLTIFISFFLKL